LPVCGYTRAPRERCFKLQADYGYCAAKKLDYYGFKLGLRVARSGMITYFPLLPARPHDIQFLEELVEGFAGTVPPADKGFIDAVRHALLLPVEKVGSKPHETQTQKLVYSHFDPIAYMFYNYLEGFVLHP
jgi:hypothetical protein